MKPSQLNHAVLCELRHQHRQRGISLIEVMLAVGAMTLLSGAAFAIYQSSANNADVRAEQANIHTIARNADMTYGALGSYAGLTTAQAIADRVPPVSMNSGVGLMSRWAQPVILEPATIDGRPNAGLKIVYHAVPTRACLKLAAAASEGMYDLEIGDTSVFHRSNNGRPTVLDIQAATQQCRNPAQLAFTYYGGATGLSAQVLTPVALPTPPPTSAPPPPAPVVAPPPVAVTPPAPSPGCAAAPTAPATGTTPAGQTCSFIWNSVAAPACWAPLALCVPIAAQPPIPTAPPAPPAVTPPIVPPVITPVCSAPLPLSESAAQTGVCPSGTLTISGANSFPQTRTRTTTYSCPDPFASPTALTGPWSAWLPAAASMCAPNARLRRQPALQSRAPRQQRARTWVARPGRQVSTGDNATALRTARAPRPGPARPRPDPRCRAPRRAGAAPTRHPVVGLPPPTPARPRHLRQEPIRPTPGNRGFPGATVGFTAGACSARCRSSSLTDFTARRALIPTMTRRFRVASRGLKNRH